MVGTTICSGAKGAFVHRCADAQSLIRARRGRVRRIPRACVPGVLALACVLSFAPASWCAGLPFGGLPARGERPGIFLQAADIPRAKALAEDAALSQGWVVRERGRTFAVFETALDEPATPGPPDETPPPFTLLRIRADFIRQPAGVNVYLFAQEVWFPRQSRQWVADVTPLYRSNLARALQSLQQRWDRFRRNKGRQLPTDGEPPLVRVEGQAEPRTLPADDDGVVSFSDQVIGATPVPDHSAVADPAAPGIDASMTPLPDPPADAEPAASGIDASMTPLPRQAPALDIAPSAMPDPGRWAYYAEQHAVQRGCDLDDLGAVLIDEGEHTEVHRVFCVGGSTLDVRCDSRSCALTY